MDCADVLAMRAEQGKLTKAEAEKLETDRSVGTALEFLKCKARRALRSGQNARCTSDRGGHLSYAVAMPNVFSKARRPELISRICSAGNKDMEMSLANRWDFC